MDFWDCGPFGIQLVLKLQPIPVERRGARRKTRTDLWEEVRLSGSHFTCKSTRRGGASILSPGSRCFKFHLGVRYGTCGPCYKPYSLDALHLRLFLGTEGFPEEGEYKRFVKQHLAGGCGRENCA